MIRLLPLLRLPKEVRETKVKAKARVKAKRRKGEAGALLPLCLPNRELHIMHKVYPLRRSLASSTLWGSARKGTSANTRMRILTDRLRPLLRLRPYLRHHRRCQGNLYHLRRLKLPRLRLRPAFASSGGEPVSVATKNVSTIIQRSTEREASLGRILHHRLKATRPERTSSHAGTGPPLAHVSSETGVTSRMPEPRPPPWTQGQPLARSDANGALLRIPRDSHGEGGSWDGSFGSLRSSIAWGRWLQALAGTLDSVKGELVAAFHLPLSLTLM